MSISEPHSDLAFELLMLSSLLLVICDLSFSADSYQGPIGCLGIARLQVHHTSTLAGEEWLDLEVLGRRRH